MSKLHISWVVPVDYPTICSIEKDLYDNPWTETDIGNILRENKVFAVSASIDSEVIAYMFYRVNLYSYDILNISVHPSFQRKKIGKKLIKRQLFKAVSNEKRYMKVIVRENNVKG